jgi:hypothetical protein
MDSVLILEGAQGIKKSSAVRILGDRFLSENLPNFNSKDSDFAAGVCWLVELGELVAMRKSDVAEINSYITTFRVGPRYRCTMTSGLPERGKVDVLNVEWEPDVPKRGQLSAADLEDYVRGRDAFMRLLSAASGLKMGVLDI